MTKHSLIVLDSQTSHLQHQAPTSDTSGVAPTPAHSLLAQHRAAIQSACVLLTQHITALERDWEPRPEEFWVAVLASLHGIRAALRPTLASLSGTTEEPDERRHRIINRRMTQFLLNHADDLIDCAGIEVTAYAPVCTSLQEVHLHQRHGVLCALRELAQGIQEAVDALTPRSERPTRARQQRRRQPREEQHGHVAEVSDHDEETSLLPCPHAAMLLSHTRCPHCGACHHDQCEARTLPCVAVPAFTVEEQHDGDQFIVRFLDAHSATVQVWVNEQREPLTTDSPFIAYREFKNVHPEAVFVQPNEIDALASRRASEAHDRKEPKACS